MLRLLRRNHFHQKSNVMNKISLPKISLEKLKIENIRLWLLSIDRKILIQNTIAVGGFLIFVLFFFLPILIHNKTVTQEVNRLRERIAQANVKITRIPEMTRQKELFGVRIKKIRAHFFETKEGDQLIEIISMTANESGTKINASRPSSRPLVLPSPFDQKYVPLSYELIVEGSYHSLGTFINKLESYSKHFAVHEVQIVGGGKDSSAHQCTLLLTAFVEQPQVT